MRKIRLWLLLGLAAGMLALGGCDGGGEAEWQEAAQTEAAGTETAKPTDAPDLAEGKLSGDDTVMMAVGEVKVTYGEVLFYLYQLKQKYGDVLGEDVWNAEIEAGRTFGAYAREELVEQLTELKIISLQAGKEGVALSDEERAEAGRKAQEFMDQLPEEGQKAYHITLDRVQSVYEENLLAGKMFDITTSGVTTDVSDEEARQTSVLVVERILEGIDKDGGKISLSEKGRQKAEKEAGQMLKDWKKAEDPQGFAESNTQGKECHRVFGADNLPEEFGEEAYGLATGAFSRVIHGENSLFLVYCENAMDEDATREKKEEIIRKKQDEVFGKAYTEWSKTYHVVVSAPLWEEISF